MSRFFATGTDSESDSSSEEEQIQRAPAATFTVSHFYPVLPDTAQTFLLVLYLITNLYFHIAV